MERTWPVEQPRLTDGVVTLRGWLPEDADDVFRACQDPAIQHFTKVPVPYSEEDARTFVLRSAANWAAGTDAPFAVTDTATGQLMGAIGLHQPNDDRTDIGAGYWTAPWGRGRGNTARALFLVTDWALSEGGLHRVHLEVEEVNTASTGVARSAGYARVAGPASPMELKGTTRWMVAWEAVRTRWDR